MKVKNGDIWLATNTVPPEPSPLQALMVERWPVKTAYWLAKLAKQLIAEHTVIDQVRNDLIKQHGSPNETGQLFVTPGQDHWEEFVAAYNELMDQELDIEGINKIVLPEANGCEVKAATLLGMMAFVEVA